MQGRCRGDAGEVHVVLGEQARVGVAVVAADDDEPVERVGRRRVRRLGKLLGRLDLVAARREHGEAAGVAVGVDRLGVEQLERVGHDALGAADEAVHARAGVVLHHVVVEAADAVVAARRLPAGEHAADAKRRLDCADGRKDGVPKLDDGLAEERREPLGNLLFVGHARRGRADDRLRRPVHEELRHIRLVVAATRLERRRGVRRELRDLVHCRAEALLSRLRHDRRDRHPRYRDSVQSARPRAPRSRSSCQPARQPS